MIGNPVVISSQRADGESGEAAAFKIPNSPETSSSVVGKLFVQHVVSSRRRSGSSVQTDAGKSKSTDSASFLQ